jgi:hypothetical protein
MTARIPASPSVARVIEPCTGGAITWVRDYGDHCGGQFAELVLDRRIVFT